jgi:hypothetical protein
MMLDLYTILNTSIQIQPVEYDSISKDQTNEILMVVAECNIVLIHITHRRQLNLVENPLSTRPHW